MFGTMINEANEPSSACRLWRTNQVETSTPPCSIASNIGRKSDPVKAMVSDAIVVCTLREKSVPTQN